MADPTQRYCPLEQDGGCPDCFNGKFVGDIYGTCHLNFPVPIRK